MDCRLRKVRSTLVFTVIEIASVFPKGGAFLTDKLGLDKPGWYPGKRLFRVARGGGRAIWDAIWLSGHGASGPGSSAFRSKAKKSRK